MKILNTINEPKDIKKLNIEELKVLASEIRDSLIKRINVTGGHMGSNLGMVEATIALHYVFNSPTDKFVFDVSHQSYSHKILTGRKKAYIDADSYFSVSGYTNPNESEHDHFIVGHTSTSVSLATGLAKARDLTNKKENIIAIIGDGSLSGGEAFEGLDNAAMLNSNFIVLVNDNDISIAPNEGGLYKNLQLLKDTEGKAECNYFKALGLDYRFVKDGNDLEELIRTFEEVKDIDHPIVIHMHTLKGKGLKQAETDKEYWHWSLPGDVDGIKTGEMPENYNSITSNYLIDKCKKDSSVVVISPATPGASGLTPPVREALGKQYVDVGIAEEHAIAFASGIATNGGKPVVEVLSTFLQRTYDQLSQDLALNKSAATILVFGGRLSGGDPTHVGSFDIPMTANIPNIVHLSPTTVEEYLAMLDWSIDQTEKTVIIRVPTEKVIHGETSSFDASKICYEVTNEGEKVALIGLGDFYHKALNVKDMLANKGINATVINAVVASSLDKEVLENLKKNHKLVVTLENGQLDGGFGEKIARFYGISDMKVLNYGGFKEFVNFETLEELYDRYHLNDEQIVNDIMNIL